MPVLSFHGRYYYGIHVLCFFSVACFKNKHNLWVEKRYCSYNLFITCLKKREYLQLQQCEVNN